jgi:hypothetical protein
MDQTARLGSTVDRGGMDKRVRRLLDGARSMGARARRCSPVTEEEDEPDEAVPGRYSPEHGWWRRGGTTEARNGGGLSSS